MKAGINRLPKPTGSLIDRDHEISFMFEGKTYVGLAGDTIASALAANDQWILSRSFKYHRPRGVLTMAGQDSNTLVQLDHEPNVAADRHPISEGLNVWGQNYRGTLDNDRDAILDRFSRFLPVGFYYRTFFRPGRRSWDKLWEPIIRRKAGLGRVNTSPPHRIYDKMHLFHDVVVVGGGLAGLAAALMASKAGADVLIADENSVLGGALTYARLDPDGLQAESRRRALVDQIRSRTNIDVMTEAICNGWFADNWLSIVRSNRLYKVRAKEVIVAAGCLEQPAQFRNNDLPGIMLGSAAQRLVRHYGVRPGRQAVVLTANAHGYGVALDLAEAGVAVAAVVDLRPGVFQSSLTTAIADRGIGILAAHCVFEAVGSRGNRHLQRVRVAPLNGKKQAAATGQWVECDLLSMSVGYTPAYQLPLQAGGQLAYDDSLAEFSITRLPSQLRIAGSMNGMFDLESAIEDGERAGWQAAKSLGRDAGPEPTVRAKPTREPVNHSWPIFPHPRGKEFVDFDEDLCIQDILNTVADGYCDLELVKRFSTVGMGPSQGRHSALPTARLVARATGRTVAEVGVTTVRPPVSGEKIGVLAGRHYHPERLTPMHFRHIEADAQMLVAGTWWRPAYYGPKAKKESCVLDEVLAVRQGIAMLDVSTIGRIEIRGPDAAEFVERMYTSTYKKQAVGRARYALMTNEMGTVIDDGVACRLSDEHFYVTSSTGSVERVIRDMIWWNARWQLDVDIAVVTSAYAAVNLTGPNARTMLAKVVRGVDVSPKAFPYMSVRECQVAGIPARVLRIGFTGELSYEIHVPGSMGEALWDRLLDAGKADGLRPYGLEASRILRLEKGHIIIGQDTDAMSTPDEVGLASAVSENKPFFVGARSIALRRRRPPKRKLVGFVMDDPAAPVPQESSLVFRNDAPVGRVTSVCRSPTLNKTIGLAYTAPEESDIGAAIHIRLHDGPMVEGLIASPHFYDPKNMRQEI
jgi:sarcosine oxidase subunit alpha